MQFECDEDKNQKNIQRHGFDFNDAYKVFEGPMLCDIDDREDYGEMRWQALGLIDFRFVKIVFTEPTENTIRIISLRKAIKYEQEQFKEKYFDGLE